jgi:hypothetical protein
VITFTDNAVTAPQCEGRFRENDERQNKSHKTVSHGVPPSNSYSPALRYQTLMNPA